MRCERCFKRARVLRTSHDVLCGRVVCLRVIECRSGCLDGDKPYRFESREMGDATYSDLPCNSSAEATDSSLRTGSTCTTMAEPPGDRRFPG